MSHSLGAKEWEEWAGYTSQKTGRGSSVMRRGDRLHCSFWIPRREMFYLKYFFKSSKIFQLESCKRQINAFWFSQLSPKPEGRLLILPCGEYQGKHLQHKHRTSTGRLAAQHRGPKGGDSSAGSFRGQPIAPSSLPTFLPVRNFE